MKNKLIIAVCIITCMSIITVITFIAIKGIKANAKESQTSSIEQLDQIGAGSIYDYIDEDTGVHYLVYKNIKSTAMSVRYNKDGSIMTE